MKKFVIACAGLAVMMASSVFAAENQDARADEAALQAVKASIGKPSSGYAVAAPGSAQTSTPPAGTPNIIGNFVLAGADIYIASGGTEPCFDCGPAGLGLTLAIPLGTISSSVTELDYEYTFQDVKLNTTCTLAFALTQGATVVQAESFPAGIYPSTWIVTFPVANPGISGEAILSAYTICNNVTQSVLKTKLIFD